MELFRNPQALIWLALCFAAMTPLFFWSAKRRRTLLSAIGDTQTLAKLIPAETPARRRLKLYLLVAGVFLLFIAWAGPQWGVELISSEAMTGHIAIALDTSLSMSVQDIKPSRMENAKNLLSGLIDQLPGYRIGVIVFSGKAHIQCPLTTDLDALKSFLDSVSVGMIPEPGTAIGEALAAAGNMLARYPGRKTIVLLTDGEDHNSNPSETAKEIASRGIKVLAVGIGNTDGDLIPIPNTSGAVSDYKKDKTGKLIVSKLGETGLMQIASVSGGAYMRLSGFEATLSELLRLVKETEKTKWKSASRTSYKNAPSPFRRP